MEHTPHHSHKTVEPQPVAATVPSQDGMAIAALVLGIISIAGGFGLLTGIPAVILGSIAMRRSARNRNLSLAGIITGAVGTLFSILLICLFIILFFIGLFESQPQNNTGPSNPYYNYSDSFRT